MGPFTLPNKTSGSGWIYIVSSKLANLPPAGSRAKPSDAVNMPKIVASSSGGNTIRTATGAHHYRFIGIEFAPVAGNFLYNNIQIGNAETSIGNLPNNIVFDRCYIHGDPSLGGRRGVAMNGIHIAVIDSHISNFMESGADSQALWATNTPGPIKIANNYLEGAGENVMFGGSDPSITNIIPSDIEIRRNHFFKPLSWIGSSWVVKNLLEFKSAQRVLVEGNTFENNWAAAQAGWSLVITPRNQDGNCPMCATRDITVRLNKWINLGNGINILGKDDIHTSAGTERISINNNVFQVTGLNSSQGRFLLLLGTGTTSGYPRDVTINHNTVFQPSHLVYAAYPTINNFDFINNLANIGGGLSGANGEGTGTTMLNKIFSNYTVTKNALIGGSESQYPANNYFPTDIAAVGFVNYSGGNYRLSTSSPYKNAGTDGKDLGADIDAIDAAIAGSGAGVPPPNQLSAPSNLKLIQ